MFAVAERLEAVSEALRSSTLGRDAVDAARVQLLAAAVRVRAGARLAELERRRGSRLEEARNAREPLAEDAARLEAIRASLSGSPDEVHSSVEQARQRVQDSGDRLSSLDGTLASGREAKGRAEGAVETAAERLPLRAGPRG